MFARWVGAILIFLTVFVSDPLHAQTWQLSHAFGSTVTVVYFLEEVGLPSTGFVGTAAGGVFRTTDGGASWQQTTVPQIYGGISDFAFKDGTIGFFSNRAAGGKSGCFKTTDAGLTWQPLLPQNDRFSVYYNRKHHRLFLSGYNNRFISSDDDGTSWSVVGPDLNGVRFANDEFGVATCYSGHNLYTNNGGTSWFDGTNGFECWNPLALPPRSDTVLLPTLFAISEAGNRVVISTDGGNLWNGLGGLPTKPTGDIRGTCQQLYAQSDSGIYSSNDEGVTWHALQGPGNYPDTRFFVVGGDRDYPRVFAGDYFGRLYLLRDELRPPAARLHMVGATRTISVKDCRPADDSIIVTTGIYCDVPHLDSITISSTPGIIVRRSRTMNSSGGRYLGYDTIWLHYAPIGLADSAIISYHYHVRDFSYDSTVIVRGTRSAAIELSVPNTLVMQVATSCRSARGSFTIVNGRCDSVTIDSIVALDSIRFRIRGLKLPITLAPYGHLDVAVDASGERQDTFYTQIRIVGELLGNTSALETEAILIVRHEGPVAISLPKSMVVQPTNICNTRLVSVPLSNVGCADIICDTVRWIVSSPDVTVMYRPTFPRVLHPDERDSVLLLYNPQRVGTETIMLSWRLRTAKSPTIDTFSLIKFSSYSMSQATASVNEIRFDSIRICDMRDTSFRVRNESCQWTQVVSSTEPSDPSFVATVPNGHWLAPGDSIDIPIALVPIAAGHHVSTLSLFLRDSGGSEQALDIPLSVNIKPGSRSLTISPASIDWMGVDPCSTHDTVLTIRNLGVCDTISLDSLWSNGSSWFRYTASGSRILAPGDSSRVLVHLVASDDPSAAGSTTIRLSGRDTTIGLSATTLSTGPRFLLKALDSTVFRAAYCESSVKQFVLRNRTCNDVVIEAVDLSDAAFALYPPPVLPIRLQAGASDTIDVIFSASDTDYHTAEFTAHSGTEHPSLTLTGVASTRPYAFAIGVYATGSTTLRPGEGTELEVRAMDDVQDSLHLESISAHLALDPDLFRVISVRAVSNWKVTNAPDGTGFILRFDRPSAGSATIARCTTLARVKLEGRLSRLQSTVCSIDRLILNDDDASYRRCVLAPASGILQPLSITLSCGDSLILARLQGLPLIVDKIFLEQNGKATRVLVNLHSSHATTVFVRMVDMSGRVILRNNQSVPAGISTVAFDAQLTSGSYEFVIESEASVLTRRLTVVH